MKLAAISLAVALASGDAAAQGSAQAPGAGNWIVSETMSPVDYRPVVVATARSELGGASMQLSIVCRGGRSEMAITAPAITRRGEEYTITYSLNGAQPVTITSASPSSGAGTAFRGDVLRLLATFPEEGEIAIRVTNRQGAVLEGSFPLNGLKMVRSRLTVACPVP